MSDRVSPHKPCKPAGGSEYLHYKETWKKKTESNNLVHYLVNFTVHLLRKLWSKSYLAKMRDYEGIFVPTTVSSKHSLCFNTLNIIMPLAVSLRCLLFTLDFNCGFKNNRCVFHTTQTDRTSLPLVLRISVSFRVFQFTDVYSESESQGRMWSMWRICEKHASSVWIWAYFFCQNPNRT